MTEELGGLLAEEELHKFYLYIENPFIPRYLDTGLQTARAQRDLTRAEFKDYKSPEEVAKSIAEALSPYTLQALKDRAIKRPDLILEE